jgi:serine/threonine-protein kinase
LRARLQSERQLPLDEAIRLAREILSALGHAHQQGLVHRDIKPENVLLSDGIALVADFGLARAVSRQGLDSQAETHAGVSPLTQAGVMLGTPHYMAPEQALGGSEVDGRADVYARGCVLYEMLAGQPPFTAPDVLTLLRRHANDPVPPLRSLRPGVPDAVTRAIEKALAKAPADRYPTAARFAEALAAATTGSPAYASAPGSAAFQPSERTIAVLPFQNLGGTKDDEYLSDGICDEVIHALGRIAGIRVIARGSSFLFRERRDDVRAIGTQLNVGVVLDGTLRRAGKRLRITAQLINVADGFQVWSERYDREVEDVFALEDDIAGAIAAVLKERLGTVKPPERESAPAAAESVRGVEHLGAAVQLDPKFAPAWGAMGLYYVTLDIYGLDAISTRRPAL